MSEAGCDYCGEQTERHVCEACEDKCWGCGEEMLASEVLCGTCKAHVRHGKKLMSEHNDFRGRTCGECAGFVGWDKEDFFVGFGEEGFCEKDTETQDPACPAFVPRGAEERSDDGPKTTRA